MNKKAEVTDTSPDTPHDSCQILKEVAVPFPNTDFFSARLKLLNREMDAVQLMMHMPTCILI
jgi:hypothetical protein